MRRRWNFLLCLLLIVSMLCLPIETKAYTSVRTLSYLNVYYNAYSKSAGQYIQNSDFTVHAIYTDGTSETITDFSISNQYLQHGDNSIRITCRGRSVTVVITATAYNSYMSSTPGGTNHGTAWQTLSYLNATYIGVNKRAGQTLSNSDFNVQAVYTDGYTEQVTNFTISNPNLQQGYNSIVITYNGQFVVMVINATTYSSYMSSTTGGSNNGTTVRTVSYLNATYNRTTRRSGEYVQNSDFHVQAVYTDGTTGTITDFSISNRYLQQGSNSIVISYGGKSITMMITATTTGSYVTSTTGGAASTPAQPVVEKQTVTVHVSNSVSGSNDFQIEKGKPIEISKPSKKGYEFSGWYTNENCVNEFVMGTTATKETYIFAKMTKYSNMSLSKKKVVLSKGKSTTVKVKGLKNYRNAKWKSSNTSVATVSSKGKIAAKRKGSATITVVLRDGTTRKCYVVVR